MEVLFLACNRKSMQEALGYVPADEMPTRETLQGYRTNRPPEEDLAWAADLFPQLCAWYADRERKRKDQEKRRARERNHG
jgi:hypothetical protein